MSADVERDVDSEIEEAEAGHVGLPVEARCTNCKRARAKRANRIQGEPDSGSFRHICHACQRVTWWNIVRVLEGGDQ